MAKAAAAATKVKERDLKEGGLGNEVGSRNAPNYLVSEVGFSLAGEPFCLFLVLISLLVFW
jgi:hypothetical protein